MDPVGHANSFVLIFLMFRHDPHLFSQVVNRFAEFLVDTIGQKGDEREPQLLFHGPGTLQNPHLLTIAFIDADLIPLLQKELYEINICTVPQAQCRLGRQHRTLKDILS